MWLSPVFKALQSGKKVPREDPFLPCCPLPGMNGRPRAVGLRPRDRGEKGAAELRARRAADPALAALGVKRLLPWTIPDMQPLVAATRDGDRPPQRLSSAPLDAWAYQGRDPPRPRRTIR